MRIHSNGYVSVGTTNTNVVSSSSVEGVVIEPNRIGVARTGGVTANFNRMSDDGDIVQFRKDGTAVGSIGSTSGASYQEFKPGVNGAGLRGGTNKLLPWKNGADADNSIDIGSTTGRFKDAFLSGGIHLGGSGAANKLDDYEEGTWTVVVADAANGGNTGSAGVAAHYTKIGRLVTIAMQVSNINTTGMTAALDLYFRNLPFAADPSMHMYGSVRLNGDVTHNGYVIAQVQSNQTYLRLAEGGSGNVDFIRVSEITSGSSDVNVSVTYITDS